jgi:hypothetical protein
MVTVDDITGAAINVGMQTITSQGWEVGMVAHTKNANMKRAHLDGNMFSVTFISNDGSVSLTRLTSNGSVSQNVIQKSMVDFVAEFVRGHGKSKPTIEYIDVAQETTIDGTALTAARMHAACVMALQRQAAAQQHKCKLQMKPSIDVQADHAMAVADMMLAPLTASNLIQPIKPADTSEDAFVATVNDGATEHHFSITGDLKKQHVLALTVKRVDETTSSDINARIERVSGNVPFKGVDKTRATILKVLLPATMRPVDW